MTSIFSDFFRKLKYFLSLTPFYIATWIKYNRRLEDQNQISITGWITSKPVQLVSDNKNPKHMHVVDANMLMGPSATRNEK